ncbi:putative DsbA family dithiol-disulfide isomerase [Albidovulum inexpectatum]|uniref:Putative DsbA family dithiol-disulfide isomerase n=1 Tax=Albidovulum inexpectatum TaxID=196587 RepID=A0A2S5JJG1_9RHOB|nr:DsbA family oxidoreductase [Albidovulum inexpectatum]PPB81531.1 putative DsbA family dithiol-disulfide isomerase [Albidovulum inexpectatum]
MEGSPLIKLDIISDVACPWCYLGKVFLDRALEAHPDHPFAIEWHPFQLNPDMPAGGMDRREYLETKFGGKEGAVRAYMPLIQYAETAGVELNLDRVKRQPNTLDAHRLIHWAGIEGRQAAAVSSLFRAMWHEGRDIGDRAVLCDIAESIGMERDLVRRLLDSDADVAEIRARDAHARARGVRGVPTFIIDNTHVLQGAQPTETWSQIIEEINRQIADGSGAASDGDLQ